MLLAVARQMQEQQLRARQLVLQQQALSAVAAASKTQREVYVGNLTAGLVTGEAKAAWATLHASQNPHSAQHPEGKPAAIACSAGGAWYCVVVQACGL